MELPHQLILLVLIAVMNLLQGSLAAISQEQKLAIKQQLELINKPAIKSFQTKFGDILDCVEINKQLAFDHPLLKNHSIQTKPSISKSKRTRSNGHSSSVLTISQLLPKNMKCPKGTVLIKRVQEQDLAMAKFAPFSRTTFSNNFNYTKFVPKDSQSSQAEHVAVLELHAKNFGVQGSINAWSLEVKPDQFSLASTFVASDDGSVYNGIIAGWSMNPYLYENYTRLSTYWTKDSGKSTGCFNIVCPGFVQTSQEVPLGIVIHPTSIDGGDQYYIDVAIEQDATTKNWWLYFSGKGVGYWPKELFSTLTDGATRGGWGGEVSSPTTEPTPAMGSGHFPDEGLKKACFINHLQYTDSSLSPAFPSPDDSKMGLSNPDCYKLMFGDAGKDWGRFIFFGGPPNCKL